MSIATIPKKSKWQIRRENINKEIFLKCNIQFKQNKIEIVFFLIYNYEKNVRFQSGKQNK